MHPFAVEQNISIADNSKTIILIAQTLMLSVSSTNSKRRIISCIKQDYQTNALMERHFVGQESLSMHA